MPEYEYRCPACGERFSRLRPMHEASEPAPCPRCGTLAVRVISRIAVQRGGCTEPAPT